MNNLAVNKCRRYTRQVIILAIIWFLLGGLSYGQTKAPKENAPVHIVSDKLEAYQQQQKVVFIGNVVAKQGELTIRGDRMTIYYLEKENPEPNEEGLAGKLDRIEVDWFKKLVKFSANTIWADGFIPRQEHAPIYSRTVTFR